jgi:hypothetical protein
MLSSEGPKSRQDLCLLQLDSNIAVSSPGPLTNNNFNKQRLDISICKVSLDSLGSLGIFGLTCKEARNCNANYKTRHRIYSMVCMCVGWLCALV